MFIDYSVVKLQLWVIIELILTERVHQEFHVDIKTLFVIAFYLSLSVLKYLYETEATRANLFMGKTLSGLTFWIT